MFSKPLETQRVGQFESDLIWNWYNIAKRGNGRDFVRMNESF